jgi:hypothetical protein
MPLLVHGEATDPARSTSSTARRSSSSACCSPCWRVTRRSRSFSSTSRPAMPPISSPLAGPTSRRRSPRITCSTTATRFLPAVFARIITACRCSSASSIGWRCCARRLPAAGSSSSVPIRRRMRRPQGDGLRLCRLLHGACGARTLRRSLCVGGALDRLEAFASFNGPDFYGLPRNRGTGDARTEDWRVPEAYAYAAATCWSRCAPASGCAGGCSTDVAGSTARLPEEIDLCYAEQVATCCCCCHCWSPARISARLSRSTARASIR